MWTWRPWRSSKTSRDQASTEGTGSPSEPGSDHALSPRSITNETAGEIPGPWGERYTPRQREILDFGWQLAQAYYPQAPGLVPPAIYLWLAEDGWLGGSTVMIERHDAATMAVTVKTWEALHLASPFNPN